MSKQVRLRRGTTAQHSTFTGADGEATFDTTKKCLVLHDGVTPGGKPIEGWVKLTTGSPLVPQVLDAPLHIGSGSPGTASIVTERPVYLYDTFISGTADVCRLKIGQAVLPYGATVNVDFLGTGVQCLTLGGNVTFTSSNVAAGRQVLLRILADGSLRTLAFPAGWKFLGGAAPANLAAGKTALLQLVCFGSADADIVARYLVES
jgi:hypothetical protein